MKNINALTQSFSHFFTAPISPKPLGIFRILIALFTLLQALLWYPDWAAFLGEDAWVQWEISKAFNQAWHIHLQDAYQLFQPLGITSATFVEIFFWVYILAAIGLLLGWFTRFWAILTWLCHYIMMSTLPTFVYGVDIFLQIALFYMMVMPVAKAFSLDIRQGRINGEATWGTTLAIRVFWLLGIIGLHIGIGLFLGLYLFGLIMILLSISAFGYEAYQDIVQWQNQKRKTPTLEMVVS